MNISRTPELEQFGSEMVKTGVYQTAGEVACEGLRLLNERDQRGDFSDFDESNIKELSDRVNARGRKRLAE